MNSTLLWSLRSKWRGKQGGISLYQESIFVLYNTFLNPSQSWCNLVAIKVAYSNPTTFFQTITPCLSPIDSYERYFVVSFISMSMISSSSRNDKRTKTSKHIKIVQNKFLFYTFSLYLYKIILFPCKYKRSHLS